MNNPTFAEQFDKITTAYYNNELEPMDPCACWWGTLLNGNPSWIKARRVDLVFGNRRFYSGGDEKEIKVSLHCVLTEANGFYSLEEVYSMEQNFIMTWFDGRETEEALFEAMSTTLDMLMALHESKGEVIGIKPSFAKRQLQST